MSTLVQVVPNDIVGWGGFIQTPPSLSCMWGHCRDGSRKKAKQDHISLSHFWISETRLVSKPLVPSPVLASLDSARAL